ncbi:chitin-binding type-2 domain-containing protein [Caerostris extrusa]|uniref:Chitin-binding type-2 domain-containing protein n=1 Tax=Caerostris extrusa TaxID=172846 RepID=A0AAV4NN16_CAEEX|nr:chitin-binding type-2 domain-containing protein [Caerostris extrusa]
MLVLSTLLILCPLVSLGRCQFYNNYDETDPKEYQTGWEEPVNRNPSGEVERIRYVPEQNQVPQRSGQRTAAATSSDYNQDVQPQRRRIRKYRKILREGEYIQPPQPPVTYSPSVFENIRLGEAPNGVYIPQDSFLNVLKTPNYNRDSPSNHYQVPQSASPYVGNYGTSWQNSEPEYKFFGQPSSSPALPQQNVAPTIVQPNVMYSPINSQYHNAPSERISTRTLNKQRNQRRPGRMEPVVDIDVLRTPPDIMVDVQSPPQVLQMTEPRSVTKSPRRRTRVRNYVEPTYQPPKVYGPSAFQNIGLGEAPAGVHIPEDSLLNILRDPSRPQSNPRYTSTDLQPSSSGADIAAKSSYQPVIPEQPVSTRRQSRQRARSSRISYSSHSNDQESVRIAPASSQNQRSRQATSNNSATNRRQRMNPT